MSFIYNNTGKKIWIYSPRAISEDDNEYDFITSLDVDCGERIDIYDLILSDIECDIQGKEIKSEEKERKIESQDYPESQEEWEEAERLRRRGGR